MRLRVRGVARPDVRGLRPDPSFALHQQSGAGRGACMGCGATLVAMFACRSRRFGTAFLVVLALLFSQLALANYVCPTASPDTEAVMEMAPGQPCEGMASDASQPVLCHQHCADAPQSLDALKLPAVSLPAVVLVLTVPASLDLAQTAAHAQAATGHAHPRPGPVFLSTLRLRV